MKRLNVSKLTAVAITHTPTCTHARQQTCTSTHTHTRTHARTHTHTFIWPGDAGLFRSLLEAPVAVNQVSHVLCHGERGRVDRQSLLSERKKKNGTELSGRRDTIKKIGGLMMATEHEIRYSLGNRRRYGRLGNVSHYKHTLSRFSCKQLEGQQFQY